MNFVQLQNTFIFSGCVNISSVFLFAFMVQMCDLVFLTGKK